MERMLHRSVKSVRLFGSRARGDHDSHSDLDVLVVAAENLDLEWRKTVCAEVHKRLGSCPSISWYTTERISELFRCGSLFAWHIWIESRKINARSDADVDFIDNLGRPGAYTSWLAEFQTFREILRTIEMATQESPLSRLYEAGLMFVCLRNATMALLSVTKEGMYFGRDAPFELGARLGLPFPLPRSSFGQLAVSRGGGLRGEEVADIAVNEIVDMVVSVERWLDDVFRIAAGEHENGCRLTE